MPPPRRPSVGESPRREHRSSYQTTPRRARPQDEEAGYYYGGEAVTPTRHRCRRSSRTAYNEPPSPQPSRGSESLQPLSPTRRPQSPVIERKRSLIRPERNRIDRDHPNYHYRQHAANMDTHPSTTGNDPLVEDMAEADVHATEATGLREPIESDDYSLRQKRTKRGRGAGPEDLVSTEKAGGGRRTSGKLTLGDEKKARIEKRRRQKQMEYRPPSLWTVYCSIITFWCPDFMLSCFGMPQKAQKRAWREKMGLVSIITLCMLFVGYLTFGFTATVCSSTTTRLQINSVGGEYMIFHGNAYDLSTSKHPAADGIPANANVLWDLPEKYGGMDGSFMFQNVNGKCKGLIGLADGSDVPSSDDGQELAWYFPCNAYNQDGSSEPNFTTPYYLGYGCHTTASARDTFYSLESVGSVYFTWDDVKNNSRNLMVYSGNVLDLDLLNWFNTSQVSVPSRWTQLATRNNSANAAVHGNDVTHMFQSSEDKAMAECFSQIIRVGSIDSESVGCIASKVVLYCSLAIILGVVLAKFCLALWFRWVLSKTYAAAKTSQSSDPKKRNRQIEEWSDDIYRAPVRVPGDIGSTVAGSSDRMSKRTSAFLPATSRFTDPSENRFSRQIRPAPITMASQQSSAPLIKPPGMYGQHNNSRGSMIEGGSQDSPYGESFEDVERPAGFMHENVIPQPPAEWQPFGYPLAHALCLVTAYSEGELGIRTTLDSIATTDYPNSHKTIFVICDGLIKGAGETETTPDIVLGMMKEFAIPPDQVPAFSYVAVASGSKRHNMAKVYSGFYSYGANSRIPVERQQRVPMVVVVKCGTPDEAKTSKPGNRGKRDSQIILMSFLQKVMFDERMTELEFELFNGIWRITGISPDFYECVLMVDADTKVFPDSLTHMVSAMVKDPEIMGLCGETKIANKKESWVTMIQVFEYFISHHQAKSFESCFGGVTCLPGCFSMYRIKAPKGGQNYWVPILANPDVVEHYSENVVDTLHKKNLLLLGEDRYLSTLMLRTFPKRKQVFVPQAVCKTTVPDKFSVLLSQRRRWINSTVHNLMELVLVRDLCGTFCFSMQAVVMMDLIGTVVLPAAIAFTLYVVIISIVGPTVEVIPLVLLALILGLPAVLIVVTAHSWSYVAWMFIYLLSLPIWNFVLPVYSFWKFDDFSWGDTRKTSAEASKGKVKKGGIEYEGEFDSSKITMRRWAEFESVRRQREREGGYSTGATLFN